MSDFQHFTGALLTTVILLCEWRISSTCCLSALTVGCVCLCVQCGPAAERCVLVLSVQTVLQRPGPLHAVLPGAEESLGAAEELPAADVSAHDRLAQRWRDTAVMTDGLLNPAGVLQLLCWCCVVLLWSCILTDMLVVLIRGRHWGGAERHRGSDRLQTSRRLPLLVPHPQRTEAGDPGVGISLKSLLQSVCLCLTVCLSAGWWAACPCPTTTGRRCCWTWRRRLEVSSRGRGWDAASRSPSASTPDSASTWLWSRRRDAGCSRASTRVLYVNFLFFQNKPHKDCFCTDQTHVENCRPNHYWWILFERLYGSSERTNG